jgi:anti-sigma factor RsiW
MNCEKVSSLLSAYFDRELEFAQSIEVAKHLENCKACQARLENLKALSEKIQTHMTTYELPADLRAKILPKAQSHFRPMTFFRGFAVGVAACAVVVFFVIPRTPSNGDELAALNLHLHSLQEGHLIDIASSDHHVVKPWLAGKLNFTFNPEDYESDGFKLLGARLEYFEGEPAVALVYKRRDHLINLLVQQDIFKRDFSPLSDVNGFHLRSWKAQGLRYIAISDIAAADLEQLQTLVISHR